MTTKQRATVTAPPRADAYFSARAAFYDSRYDRVDADGYALRARMAAVIRFAGEGPGDALDAGMGPGRLCAELAARGWTVSGVDASDGMVEVARERLPAARDRLLHARIEELPFEDASFDLVTATGVLEYSDVPRALSELARVVRPGGCVVVSYPNPGTVYGTWKLRVFYPAVQGLKRMLRRPSPGRPRGTGPPLPPPAFTARLAEVGLEPTRSQHASYLPFLTPAELLFPRTCVRLAAACEGRGGLASKRLATQIVYEAWRR